MDAWTTFWGWLLVTVLVVYVGLVIAITIGGFFDVMGMFATMDEQHKLNERAKDDPKSARQYE